MICHPELVEGSSPRTVTRFLDSARNDRAHTVRQLTSHELQGEGNLPPFLLAACIAENEIGEFGAGCSIVMEAAENG